MTGLPQAYMHYEFLYSIQINNESKIFFNNTKQKIGSVSLSFIQRQILSWYNFVRKIN